MRKESDRLTKSMSVIQLTEKRSKKHREIDPGEQSVREHEGYQEY